MYRIENWADVYRAVSEVWTRLSVAYLLLVQSVADPCLHNFNLCAMTFRCVRNLAFCRIQVVWGRNLNKTCSGSTGSTKGWSRCDLGRGVRYPNLELLWGPQRDKALQIEPSSRTQLKVARSTVAARSPSQLHFPAVVTVANFNRVSSIWVFIEQHVTNEMQIRT